MSSPSTSSPNCTSCSHLWIYKVNQAINHYRSLKIPIERSKVCSFCSKNLNRLYFCLICSTAYCSDHILVHIESNPDHEVGLDVERLELYCFKCQDQIYDAEFDKVVEMKRKSRCKKRKIVDKRTEMGLRGLNNLGNTCFMNSILQALVHIPQFKEHFLGHKDVCKFRKRRKTAETKGEVSCLACDLDKVFTAIYSGDQNPYSPAEFLYRWWQHSPTLAGYKQQDAHEFFISVLDKIHENEKPYKFSKAIGDCLCIAHKVFTGILKSDVTCTKCGFTSSTYDPCIDISLDFEPIIETTTAPTLTRCLDHFTRPEKLGSDQKLYCQNCQLNQEDWTKQMSIQKLPTVLCLHVKRFEHSMIHEASKKINQYLKFPFTLQLKQYMSSSSSIEPEGGVSDTEYELFSIVSHIGRMNSGHYVMYIRLRGEWYLCNDAWVVKVSEKVVKNSQAYMMYYMQKVLYYKTGL